MIRAVLLAGLCLWAAGALAHTQLSSSSPGHEAVLSTPPEKVSLTFSESVRLTLVSVEAAGISHRLDVDASSASTNFELSVPQLAPGKYTIRWRALSADTHVMSGEIVFTVSS